MVDDNKPEIEDSPVKPLSSGKPKDANKIPSHLQEDSKVTKTYVKTFKKMVQDTLIGIEERLTLEVKMPVISRMRKRLKEIKELSSAKNIKINGHWHTESPKFHICKLAGQKISNDRCEITYSVYAMDKEGNKILRRHYAEVEQRDGGVVKRETSNDYPIAFEVKEIMETNKPREKEITELEYEEQNKK